MKYFYSFLFLFSFLASNQAQILDASNSVDWSQAGLTNDIPEYQNIINVEDYGAVGDSLTDNVAAIEAAILAAGTEPTVILFPAGKYYFSAPIILSDSIVLRGAASDESQLYFDLDEYLHCIEIKGDQSLDTIPLLALPIRGANTIEVLNAASLNSGDYIKIIRNDSDLIYSYDWAFETTGQIIQVNSISGNTLQLNSAIRDSYDANDVPRIIVLEMVTGVGVECLGIDRLDATVGQTNNIKFENAAECWVKGVESNRCNYAHVDIRKSTNIEVRESYFHHGHDYGGGGQAYGVMLHLTTGECLVENNVFEHLRHSMIVQAGANGNVFGYNYSFDPYWLTATLPEDSAGDMVLHGNYPYANLFEGNIGQNIVIDDSHGFNGPYNTVFRNKAENYGIFMAIGTYTDNQNLIGNVLSGMNAFYLVTGIGHVQHGNNHLGMILPEGTETLNDISLYYTNQPSFMQNIPEWPPIGLPLGLDDGNNAAKQRYTEGYASGCQTNQVITSKENIIENTSLKLYPNPTKDWLYIEGVEGQEIEVFDIHARSLLLSTENKINVSQLTSGVYLIRIGNDLQKWIKH